MRTCRFVSCAECYKDNETLPFPVNRPFGDEVSQFRRRQVDELEFMIARKGDWIHAPFQCEECWFQILHGRVHIKDSAKDQKELYLMRRVNLDIFWSRAAGTVKGYFGRTVRLLRESAECGRISPFTAFPVWPETDEQGMGIALLMLTDSLKGGRNNDSYTQFATCRQNRSVASNIYQASSHLSEDHNVLKSKKGDALHLHSDPMQSMFMERFSKGMERRMPEETDRDEPLMGTTVAGMLKRMKFEYLDAETGVIRKRSLVMTGAYMAVCYGASLRGHEGLWVCGKNLVEHILVGKEETEELPGHVLVPLVGFFKGENGMRMHVCPIANETKSGVQVRWWLEELTTWLKEEDNLAGPAFCDKTGYQLSERQMEEVFQPVLEGMIREGGNRKWWPNLSVQDYCKCYRSFRRGATSTAMNNDVEEAVIVLVNRWREYERNKGKQPGFKMMHHYASGSATLKKQLSFSMYI